MNRELSKYELLIVAIVLPFFVYWSRDIERSDLAVTFFWWPLPLQLSISRFLSCAGGLIDSYLSGKPAGHSRIQILLSDIIIYEILIGKSRPLEDIQSAKYNSVE